MQAILLISDRNYSRNLTKIFLISFLELLSNFHASYIDFAYTVYLINYSIKLFLLNPIDLNWIILQHVVEDLIVQINQELNPGGIVNVLYCWDQLEVYRENLLTKTQHWE